MRIHDSEFDEKEGEHRKDDALHDTDEHFERHQRYREEVWYEEGNDADEDLPGKDVTEKTERERHEARDLAHELDEADGEIEGRGEIDEFPRVAEKSERRDAGDFDDDHDNNRKRERHVEIGIDGAQERCEFAAVRKSDRADAGRKFKHVGKRDEKKDCHEEREDSARNDTVPQRLRDVIVCRLEQRLKKDLRPRRDDTRSRADQNANEYQEPHHDPACDQRVRYRDAPHVAESLCGERNMDAAFVRDIRMFCRGCGVFDDFFGCHGGIVAKL